MAGLSGMRVVFLLLCGCSLVPKTVEKNELGMAVTHFTPPADVAGPVELRIQSDTDKPVCSVQLWKHGAAPGPNWGRLDPNHAADVKIAPGAYDARFVTCDGQAGQGTFVYTRKATLNASQYFKYNSFTARPDLDVTSIGLRTEPPGGPQQFPHLNIVDHMLAPPAEMRGDVMVSIANVSNDDICAVSGEHDGAPATQKNWLRGRDHLTAKSATNVELRAGVYALHFTPCAANKLVAPALPVVVEQPQLVLVEQALVPTPIPAAATMVSTLEMPAPPPVYAPAAPQQGGATQCKADQVPVTNDDPSPCCSGVQHYSRTRKEDVCGPWPGGDD